MFNLFKKKQEGAKVTDTVFISTAAKYQAMIEEWKKDKSIVYLFWFDDSLSEAATFFSAATTEEDILLLTRQATLDEPLYKHFGADRIIDLVQKLGMKENEAIEHSMVSSSIKKAQKKIEKNVVFEQTAHSQSDWLQKNYKP